MRLPSALIGLLALLSGSAAGATVSAYTLTGTLTGSQTTVACNPLDPACFVTTPFTQDFGVIVFLDLSAGSNDFIYGSPYAGIGSWHGTIVDNGGLTGLDLTFSRTSCGPGTPAIGCVSRTGSSATFNVEAGAVPEPATWAMLLLGFALIGVVLRIDRKHLRLRARRSAA
jgi:hypothetical protein